MAGIKWEQVRVGRSTLPGVYRRTDESGRVRYRAVVWAADPDQPGARKQVARTFDRLEDARDFREDFGGTRPKKAPRQRKVTLRELKAELEASEDYAEATLKRDGFAWAHVEAARLADRPIGAIERADVDRLIGRLKDRPSMAAKVRSLVSKLFERAIEHGLADSNPAAKARKPRTRAARMEAKKHGAGRKLRILEEKDLRRLITEVPERWRAMVELMAYEGLRPGEAVALRVGKFDPLRRTLTIDTSVTGVTKTGETRTLVLPAVLADMLTEHLARFSDPADAEAPMFPREKGAGISSKNEYDAWSRRVFGAAAERAGVDGDLSPNDLRHHAVAFAIGHGADVYSVQRMLGHARPSITLDVYGHLWDSSAEQLAERLDEAIRASRVPTRAVGVVVPLQR